MLSILKQCVIRRYTLEPGSVCGCRSYLACNWLQETKVKKKSEEAIVFVSHIFVLSLLRTVSDSRYMKNKDILLAAELAAILTFGFNNSANAAEAADVPQVQDTLVLGKLYFVNVQEGEQPVMTALSLYGDRCGSEAFNSKPYSSEGIRSVFELNEWVEFNPQASVGSGIKVMVFSHKAEQKRTSHGARYTFITKKSSRASTALQSSVAWVQSTTST